MHSTIVIGVNGRLNSDKASDLLNWIPKHKSIDDEIVEVINKKRAIN